MNEHDRQQLEYLKSNVECLKNFACVKNKFRHMCSAEFHNDRNELECQEERADSCKFAEPREDKLVCTCDLRIFIAQNLDQWITTNTAF